MLGSKVSKAILNYLGYAVPCYVICPENSRYFLHQSYSKLKPIANCSLAFSRALTSLPIFTSSSLWLLVIISLLWLAIVIALVLALRKLLNLSISRTRCVIQINHAFCFPFFIEINEHLYHANCERDGVVEGLLIWSQGQQSPQGIHENKNESAKPLLIFFPLYIFLTPLLIEPCNWRHGWKICVGDLDYISHLIIHFFYPN